jgi:signal transduction histidine kinase
LVEGHLWGGVSVSSKQPEPLPPDTEARIANFAELVATAIANAEARTELAASRARVVAAADETRRRLERNLHDGAQQRLVSLALELRGAEATVAFARGDLGRQLSRIGEGLNGVLEDLREISRGLHPAILSEAGLKPALKALARRSAVPVQLEARVEARLPESIEWRRTTLSRKVSRTLSSMPTLRSPKSISKQLRATSAFQSVTMAREAPIPPEVPG